MVLPKMLPVVWYLVLDNIFSNINTLIGYWSCIHVVIRTNYHFLAWLSYFKRILKNGSVFNLCLYLGMTKLVSSIFIVVFLMSCSAIIPRQEKINGVSFVASRDAVTQVHIDPVVNVNANYAAVMPFGFIRNLQSPEIVHNTDRQWFGETRAGAKQYIDMLHKNNIKVMVKPQIWIWRGEFTGNLKMNSEDDWKALEASYEDFILEYAAMAEESQAVMYCIGTELNAFVSARPDFWNQLIQKVKAIYKGKLTYAENWDTFNNVPFWKALDFIGIDAYFPLSEEETPELETLKKGWQPHKAKIFELYEAIDKPILFTEYGYRSTHFTAKEPWNSDHTIKDINLEGQTIALQALYNEFWKEDWFAGGFIWKWFHAHDRVGGEEDSQFTPQNKPAEAFLKMSYGKYKPE